MITQCNFNTQQIIIPKESVKNLDSLITFHALGFVFLMPTPLISGLWNTQIAQSKTLSKLVIMLKKIVE